MIVTPSNNVSIKVFYYYVAIYSSKVTEVLNEGLNSQVNVSPSVDWKEEKLRMISVEPLVTNTLDEAFVLDMLTEPLFQASAAVLQERASGSPTVARWLLPHTRSPLWWWCVTHVPHKRKIIWHFSIPPASSSQWWHSVRFFSYCLSLKASHSRDVAVACQLIAI